MQGLPGADRVGTVTELGRHKLGKHSATNLSPELDDYELAAELVREAGQLALLMRQGGLEGQRKTSVSDVVTAADHAAGIASSLANLAAYAERGHSFVTPGCTGRSK